jgi:hypothetical protein
VPLPHQEPLALPFTEHEGFRRSKLSRLLIPRLHKAEKHAPVLYERDGPTTDRGRLGFIVRTQTQLGHARLSRGAPDRSRVGAILLPSGQELRLCLFKARRAPARLNAELWIDVDRDRPKPAQLRRAMPIFIDAPHVAAILDDHLIEPIPIGGR